MADLSITARLGLDGSQFEKGLSGLSSRIAATFSVAAIAAFSKSVIDFGSNIKDTATRLGLTTDSVQELSFAAKQSGSDLDSVARGIEHIAKAQEEIRKGGESGSRMTAIFGKFGFSELSALTTSPEQIFRKMAEALKDSNIEGQTQAELLELFGKSAGQLIPVMKELGDNIRDIRKSGGIITSEEIELLDKAGDRLDKIATLAKVAGAKLLTKPIEFLDLFNLANTAEIIANKLGFAGHMPGLAADAITQQAANEMAAKNKTATDDATTNALFDLFERNSVWDSPKAKAPLKRSVESIATDSLISVGNFLGASGRSTLESAAQRQVQLLGSINQHLAKIANTGGLDSVTP